MSKVSPQDNSSCQSFIESISGSVSKLGRAFHDTHHAISQILQNWESRLSNLQMAEQVRKLFNLRMRNAKRYLEAGELGACQFELDLIQTEFPNVG